MKLKLYQVDAFTSKRFQGNPAAICPLENWLSDEMMQAIAAENNLAETAFYVPKGEDFHLRWFTPTTEVALCGHATLATAHILYSVYGYAKDVLRFHTQSGILTVSKEEDWLKMNFPADEIVQVEAPKEILEGLGVQPKEVYRGKTDFLVILDHQTQIENLHPDFRLLATQEDARGTIVTAPGKEVDFVSRCFFPQSGIDEDPVTGSAHTTMIPYWAHKLDKKQLTAQQLSSRTGFLKCTYAGDRVEIAGQAVTYLAGEIEL